jgi:hypothetical protein
MKKLILLSLLLFSVFEGTTFADGVIMKPSLMAQMKYQENINRLNDINEKKLKNKMRLAEIRSKKFAEKYKTSIQSITPVSTSISTQNITS